MKQEYTIGGADHCESSDRHEPGCSDAEELVLHNAVYYSRVCFLKRLAGWGLTWEEYIEKNRELGGAWVHKIKEKKA